MVLVTKTGDVHDRRRTYICFPLKINLCTRANKHVWKKFVYTVTTKTNIQNVGGMSSELTSAGEVGFLPSPQLSPLFSPPTHTYGTRMKITPDTYMYYGTDLICGLNININLCTWKQIIVCTYMCIKNLTCHLYI